MESALALSKALLRQGDQEQAKEILRRLLDREPHNFEALFDLAFASDITHDYGAFADYIEKAIGVNPSHAQAWLYKAMSDERKADYKSATASYTRAAELGKGTAIEKDAAHQMEMLRRNLSCPLITGQCWDDAAPRILSQRSRLESVELGATSLMPPRPLFRTEFCVHVWDDALSPSLLKSVRESLDDLSTYLIRNPKHCRTCWLPRDAEPKTAVELAGRILLEKLIGCKSEEFVGIEWWCKSQSASLGAHFHYDAATADGGLFRPTYSSVLYLADAGGPTVILDQAADLHHAQWPEVPQEGYLVMPRLNRYMVFPGELRHGMITIDDCKHSRYVVLFNFWSSHRPSPPNCDIPDLATYQPLSAKSVLARYLLKPQELAGLEQKDVVYRTEGLDGQCGAACVPIERLTNTTDFEAMSTFGELSFPMPMPSSSRMQVGAKGAAALYMPWREIAAQALDRSNAAEHGNEVDRSKSGRLTDRLPLWEQTENEVAEDCTTIESRAWLQSEFLATAKKLATAEWYKHANHQILECRLSLTSLTKYITAELKRPLSATELKGALTTVTRRNANCQSDHAAISDALLCALFTALEAEMKSIGFLVDACRCEQSDEYGFIMFCGRIRFHKDFDKIAPVRE